MYGPPVPRPLLFSGFDLRAPELPSDVRMLLPPLPLEPLADVGAACDRALETPDHGPSPLPELRATSRVTLVIDDPSLTVPLPASDFRRRILERVTAALTTRGIPHNRISVLIANGLSRKWRPTELGDLFGVQLTGGFEFECHDAEAGGRLFRLGDEPEGPVEVHRALVDADLVIHLTVVTQPIGTGFFNLVQGTAGYRTARTLNAPQLFRGDSPFLPGSPYHALHERVGQHLQRAVPVFQIACVLDNELWPLTLGALLRPGEGLSRPLQMWNALPTAVRLRAARMLRSAARPIALVSGPPAQVGPTARERFLRQHQVTAEGPSKVVVFGVPDLGPSSMAASQNPILSAALALGLLGNLHTERPLLAEGGVVVFANPMTPLFDRRAHLPHEEFYERVLRIERDPLAIHERFEPYFAGRPEFVANYQRRFAFHGTHPLWCWYQLQPLLRRAAKVVVAYGDPRACARLGFAHATDVEEALRKARELLDDPSPSTTVLQLPPAFWVRVR